MKRVTSLILLMLFLALAWNTNAAVSTYTFASSSGTYTPITGGTLLVSGTSSMDSWVSTAQTIPSFTFNGTAYTTAYVTSNGQISLGGSAPSTSTYTGISTGVGSGINICPFSADMDRATTTASTEIRWETVGNEVVFQWQQVKRYGSTNVESFDMQARLNTSTGVILFVYKLNTGPGSSTSYFPQVGIRTSSTDYVNRLVGTGTEDWATSLTGATNASTCRFTSVSPAKGFATGLTYSFTPADPNQPVPPTTPSPANAAVGVPLNGNLTWTFGANTLTYDLLFGPTGNMSMVVSGGTAGATGSYTYSGLNPQSVYQWQVIEKHDALVTNGPIWSFTTACSTIATYPFTESFAATLGCWTASEALAGATYHWATTTADATHGVAGPKSGTHFAFLNVYNASTTYNPYYLVSQPFILDATAKRIKYYYWLGAAGNTTTPVPLTLQISTNGGSSWVDLFAHTTANSTFSSTSATTGWTLNTVSLEAYTNQTAIFRFASNSNFGSGFCNQGIDEFIVEDAPTCTEPTGLAVSAITTTGASIGWTGATNVEIDYGTVGHAAGTGTNTGTVSANPYAISGLTSNTAYDVFVRQDCGSGVYSSWNGPINFRTLCDPSGIINENFDAAVVPALPNCWNKFSSYASGTVTTISTTYNSAPNCAQLYNSGAVSTDNILLISPQLTNLGAGTNELVFWAKSSTVAITTVIVGTMTDPANGATFTPFQTVTINNTAFTKATVSFESYTGADTYIAFRHPSISTYSNVYIDDVVWQALPPCPKPSALDATNILATQATLSWVGTANATSFDIEWGPTPFTPTGTPNLTGITNPYTLTGLTALTGYAYYVRANCDANGYSDWSGPKTFTTPCAVSTLPYSENFTGLLAGQKPPCMSTSTIGATNWGAVLTANALGTSPEMRFYFSPSFTGLSLLKSPVFNTTGAAKIAINFKHFLDWYASPMTIGVKTSSDGITWNTVWSVAATGNIGPETKSLLLSGGDVGSATFQFAFFFEGYSFNIDYWYIDDVVAYVPTFGTLEGTVTSATSKGPIEGAVVHTGAYSATTNAAGYYIIPEILAGNYTLTCDAAGYISATAPVTIVLGETTVQDFALTYSKIQVSPLSLTQALEPELTASQVLTISNVGGTGPLTWNASIELPSDNSASAQPIVYDNPVALVNNNPLVDASPTTSAVKSDLTDATWDIAFTWSANGGAQVGIETDGLNYYTSTWSASGVFSKYTLDGTFVETFTIAGVGGIRDLAYDGQYFYGGASSTTIYILDLVNKVLVGTIVTPATVLTRHISYDPTIDGFWCGNWTTLFQVSRAGAILTTGPAVVSVYGSAYDAYTPGGPYLWLNAQVAVTGCGTTYDLVQAQQFKISTNALTGVAHCETDIPGYIPGTSTTSTIAGGMCSSDKVVPGKFVLITNIQQSPNLIGAYVLADLWLGLDTYSGTVAPGQSQDVNVNFNSYGLKDPSTHSGTITINHNALPDAKGSIDIPVTLNVAWTTPPAVATNPNPAHQATFVPLLPVFSWTNGDRTDSVKIIITRGALGIPVYTSPYFVGNSFDLATTTTKLLKQTLHKWKITSKNSAGTVTSAIWEFTTKGEGTLEGTVTDAYTGQPLEGVTITADELRSLSDTTDANGFYKFEKVPEGSYTVKAELPLYVTQTAQVAVQPNLITTQNFALNLYLEPPLALQAHVVDYFDVHLTWVGPGAFIPAWLTYSQETITNSIGTNAAANFDVAARFLPADLAALAGGSVTKVKYVPGETGAVCTYTIKIWEGVSPPTLIYSEVIPTANVAVDVWNEVTLATPVPIDATKELWIGFNCNTTTGWPAGCDDGPQDEGLGNMMYWNGAWTTLSTLVSTLTFNWAVKGYIDAAKGSSMLQPIVENTKPVNNSGMLASRPVMIDPPAVSVDENGGTRPLTSYNIYRDGALIGNTPTTTFDDLDLVAGDYAYTVKGVYPQGLSAAAGPVIASIMPPPTLLTVEQAGLEVYLEWESNQQKSAVREQTNGKLYAGNVMPAKQMVKNGVARKAKTITIPGNGRLAGETCEEAVTAVVGLNTAPEAPYWFEFTPETDQAVTITSCMAGQLVDTDLEVYDACGGALVSANDDLYEDCASFDYSSGLTFNATAGVSYKISWIDTWETTGFDFTIEVADICLVPCPPGSIAEGEECIGDEGFDVTNGGCNLETPLFSPISCGDVICGTASTYTFEGLNYRETDWYEFVVDSPKTVTFTVNAEFPVVAGLNEQYEPGVAGCDNNTGYISPYAVANPCNDASVTVTLAPGTYSFFVSLTEFVGYPCGSYNNYVATLTCEDTFLSYYNVFRDGVDIADVYGSTYSDSNVELGTEYCYTVSEVVGVGPTMETGQSNELCTTIVCPVPYNLAVSNVTTNSANLSWSAGSNETSWNLIYGPIGFNPETAGTLVPDLAATTYVLGGLEAFTAYDFYVQSVCTDVYLSEWAGPVSFKTLCENTCAYTFNLIDDYGDGWNGATMQVIQDGYVIAVLGADFDEGDLFTQYVELCDGYAFSVKWNVAGSWPGEVGLQIVDPSGVVLYNAPLVGSGLVGTVLYTGMADCPACIPPLGLTATDITASSALLGWTSEGTLWNLEWGTFGFVQGQGTLVSGLTDVEYLLSGLELATEYSFYVQTDCGEAQSVWMGPYTFQTAMCETSCAYKFTLTDTFGDGWNGATMQVLQNNEVIATLGTGFTTGSSFIQYVNLCDNMEFSVYWNLGGSYASEVGLNISDPFGVTLYNASPVGSLYVGTTLYTGMSSCTPFECPTYELPFAEGFEGDFAPLCWTNDLWVQSLYGSAHSGFEWAYSNTLGSELTTPEIVIPETGQYNLSFWYRAESASYPQDMDVLISTDGTNFSPLATMVDIINATYAEMVISLNAYTGQNVWLKFVGMYGVGGYDYGICVDDVTVYEYVPPTQDILLPLGWSGWSSFIAPAAKATFADVVAPVANDIIITQYFSQLYWPEYGINTMGDFSNAHGYLTKMAAEATLTLTGDYAPTTVTLNAGWNIFPVLSTCNVDADELLNIEGLVIAIEVAGNGIYYPAYNINTLLELVPGKAYFVKTTTGGDFTFPVCAKTSGYTYQKPVRSENITNWNDVNYTGVSHAVIFSENAVSSLANGDVIGAFTNSGLCAGMTIVNANTMGMSLFADDISTGDVDGFAEGEMISFRVMRPSTSEEFTLDVTYNAQSPNYDGLFASNGLSVVNNLTMSITGINVDPLNGLSIYPNPSNGIFNIAISGMDKNIDYVITNAQGQQVIEGKLLNTQIIDLTAQPKGVYFIKFTSDSVLRIEKVVVK